MLCPAEAGITQLGHQVKHLLMILRQGIAKRLMLSSIGLALNMIQRMRGTLPLVTEALTLITTTRITTDTFALCVV